MVYKYLVYDDRKVQEPDDKATVIRHADFERSSRPYSASNLSCVLLILHTVAQTPRVQTTARSRIILNP